MALDLATLKASGMVDADRWFKSFTEISRSAQGAKAWKALLDARLLTSLPLSLHEAVFSEIYKGHDEQKEGPPPAWFPSRKELEGSNLARAIAARGVPHYSGLFDWSVKDRGAYWQWAIDQVGFKFHTGFDSIVDLKKGPHHPEWLKGAELNIAESCFQAPAEKRALICVSENGQRTEWTFAQLRARADQVARGLQRQGFKKGQRFAVFMPMHAEAVAIYLGVVLFGGAIVSIADSFSVEEIDTRLRISGADILFTQDGMLRGGKVIDIFNRARASKAKIAIVLQTQPAKLDLRKGDLLWSDFLPSHSEPFEAAGCTPDDVTNVLFSSGTTGDPKAIPWTHTTPMKAAVDAYFHLDVMKSDTVAWPTNLGWMMGPWLIYASLVNQATLALYDGGTAQRGFGSFIETEKVSVLGLVPSIVKSWRESKCMEGLNWSAIKCFSSTGECSNSQDYLYLMALAGYRPVIEYCGGTEIGGAYLTGTLLTPASPATFTTPTLGLDLEILDDNGKPSNPGEVYLAPPSIGLSTTLLNRDHAEVYEKDVPGGKRYPVLRRHGDQIEALPGGYFRALGRADDTMNLGGIKVSSAEIERVLNRVDGVLETAAIAINPPGGGPSLLVVFAVLKSGARSDAQSLLPAMQKRIKTDLNPLFKIHDLRLMEKLPRTASNKVMRRVLRHEFEESEKAR
jgi:acetyl-CoA synthetase